MAARIAYLVKKRVKRVWRRARTARGVLRQVLDLRC